MDDLEDFQSDKKSEKTEEKEHTMWTSLVRHYLTFMGGSDAQQVAYAVTLLRNSAHE